MTSKEFSLKVETFAKEHSLTYLESLSEIVTRHNVEEKDVKSLVTKSLKEKLKFEAIGKNMLKEKKSGVLPI